MSSVSNMMSSLRKERTTAVTRELKKIQSEKNRLEREQRIRAKELDDDTKEWLERIAAHVERRKPRDLPFLSIFKANSESMAPAFASDETLVPEALNTLFSVPHQ